MRRSDVTLIHVTHDQAEALALSDRIAVMQGGRLLQVAPPQALYDAPASAFVARFVGENNRLPGRVCGRDPDEDDLALIRLPAATTCRRGSPTPHPERIAC